MAELTHFSKSSIKLAVYANCDDIQLCWRTLNEENKDVPIQDCIGFMIERKRKVGNNWSEPEILRNRVGFGINKVDSDNPKEISRPSNIWPFQRYDWTDHGANSSDIVQYRVSALGKENDTALGEGVLPALFTSEWTQDIMVNASAGEDVDVFFNRGTMMSQYVARYAREKNWSATDIKKQVKTLAEPLRVFLSGELRIAIVKILDDVIANPFLSVYAILFELADAELIDKITRMGDRANVILSDGANKKQEKGG